MIKRIGCIALLAMLGALALAQEANVIREIVVNGNQNVSREAILAAMRTRVGQPYVQAQLDEDKATIEEMGFFQAVDVRARSLDAGNWQVVVDVQEWPVVKEIRIVGNKAIKEEDIRKALTIEPGQVFNLKQVRPSADAIRRLYSNRGFRVGVEEFGPLRESPNTINIVLVEVTVGSVSVQGNTRTRDYVIRRLIKTRAGDPYNAPKWDNDLRRLYGTQWFENVRTPDTAPDETGKIDLIVDVTETRTGNFGVGLQVDPRSSFAGFVRLTDTNFRGTGQSVGVNYLQSTAGGGPSLDLEYGNPFIDNRDTSLRVALYSRLVYRFQGAFAGGGSPTLDDRYHERRTGGTLGLARPIADDTYASISGRFENIKTGDLTIDPKEPNEGLIQQDGDVAVLTLGLTRNRRDVDIDPSRGDWIRLEFEPGYSNITDVAGAGKNENILGANYFTRANIEFRKYWTPQPPRDRNKLDDPRRVLAFRARYGVISGEVPFFEQFFAGGSDTLRGYREDRFWGRQMLLTTLEYRHPIQRSFNVIAFVDYGGAWGGYGSVNEFTQSDRPSLHLGYGLGLSFRTPLGPIRLDFGFNENGGTRTHFLIGTSF